MSKKAIKPASMSILAKNGSAEIFLFGTDASIKLNKAAIDIIGTMLGLERFAPASASFSLPLLNRRRRKPLGCLAGDTRAP